MTLFADYFQFYLQDDSTEIPTLLEDLWTKQTLADMCALEPGFVAVSTVRNMSVPVTIEIRESLHQTEADLSSYDHVVECSIVIKTGQMVVMGCGQYYPGALRIPLTPGTYQITLYYQALDTLRENGLEGDDHYTIVVSPGQARDLRVVKRYSGAR
jgi:hypothetical protein